jgi:hypothetical protein
MRYAIRSAFLLLSSVGTARFAPTQSPSSQYARVAVVALQTAIDSRTARTNDRTEAKLLTDWILRNTKVPAGSRLHGVVMNANAGSVTLEYTQYSGEA